MNDDGRIIEILKAHGACRSLREIRAIRVILGEHTATLERQLVRARQLFATQGQLLDNALGRERELRERKTLDFSTPQTIRLEDIVEGEEYRNTRVISSKIVRSEA